jgi:lactoylglutathione lyase
VRAQKSPSASAADVIVSMRAVGMRYITVQVRDVDAEHRRFMSMGVWEGAAPVSLGAVARISFIRDPDGNFIEISQRASLTGPLPD